MVLNLLLLNSFTLHTLFWVGLLCFLWSALRLAGIKPMTKFSSAWQTLKKLTSGLKSALHAALVRTKDPEIEAHRAFLRLRIIGPYLLILCAVFYGGYLFGRHSALRSNYAKEYADWQQRSAEWQRTYADFKAKHKELTSDNETRRLSSSTAGTTATASY